MPYGTLTLRPPRWPCTVRLWHASGAEAFCKEANLAVKHRATFAKRERERALQQHREEKAAKKQQRKTDKPDRPGLGSEQDPDIAGIVPGPQPRSDET